MFGVVALGAAGATGSVVASQIAPQDTFLNYGAIGAFLVIVLAVAGYLYKGRVGDWNRERALLIAQLEVANGRADAERARADVANEQTTEMVKLVQTQTMAALQEAQRTVTEALARRR